MTNTTTAADMWMRGVGDSARGRAFDFCGRPLLREGAAASREALIGRGAAVSGPRGRFIACQTSMLFARSRVVFAGWQILLGSIAQFYWLFRCRTGHLIKYAAGLIAGLKQSASVGLGARKRLSYVDIEYKCLMFSVSR